MWLPGLRTFSGADVVRFSGRSANHAIESGPCRSRSKVCGEKRQDARLKSRRRQDAAGFNSQEFGVRLTDLALIAAMFYSFARVSAVLKLKVDDYYHNGARRMLRLHEKGGKAHDMPVHHLLEQILNASTLRPQAFKAGNPCFRA